MKEWPRFPEVLSYCRSEGNSRDGQAFSAASHHQPTITVTPSSNTAFQFTRCMKPFESSSDDAAPEASAGDQSPKARNEKKRKRRSKAPKPGDEGYMSATQLRNARKRRAKKQKQQSKTEKDPSQLFLANPKDAPIVQTAKAFFKEHETDFGITMGATKGWRTVAKLAVRPSDDNQVMIGLFAPNSHRLIPVPQCVAHHPSINAAVTALEKICPQVGVQAFDETSGTGHLRHVAINVERATGKVQITLIWNSQPYSEGSAEDEGKQGLDSLCKALISTGGGNSDRKRRRGRQSHDKATESCENSQAKFQLHSLWIHFNSNWKHSNAIFSIDSGNENWEHRFGPSRVTEILDLKESGPKHPISLRFPPNVFRQANIDAFANIVAQIRGRLTKFVRERRKRDRSAALPACLELYGGVGTIGLHLADLSSSLVSSDENPFNEACFNESASELPNDLHHRVSYKPLNASDMVKSGALEQAEVVIVDPPRKGLDKTVLHGLCTESSPKLLVYVSCGFEAFQRDFATLIDSKWRLELAHGHLLFPGSDAIETLAFFVSNDE